VYGSVAKGQCTTLKVNVILTGGKDLTGMPCRRRTATKVNVILTGGRDLTEVPCRLGEMVRFTHHDSDSHWFLQRMAA
jgi:hypothetical protein